MFYVILLIASGEESSTMPCVWRTIVQMVNVKCIYKLQNLPLRWSFKEALNVKIKLFHFLYVYMKAYALCIPQRHRFI